MFCQQLDEHRLVSASADGTLKVWDMETSAPLAIWRTGSAVIHAVLSDDRRHIAAVTYAGLIWVWDLRSGPLPGFEADPLHAVGLGLDRRLVDKR